MKLSEIGQLMAAQDARAEMAWTWWLFHLHLCNNPDSFPYSGFFQIYDTEGRWLSMDDIVDCLAKEPKRGSSTSPKRPSTPISPASPRHSMSEGSSTNSAF